MLRIISPAFILGVGFVFALPPCVASLLNAQQKDQVVKLSVHEGDLEISAINQSEQERLITIKLGGRVLKQFKTHFGDWLDILASYSAEDATYVVLRTNIGNGACGGTSGLYVLALDESDIAPKEPLAVSVSPILDACLGEMPQVKFDIDARGNQIVSVNEYELRHNKWINTRKRRAERTRLSFS